MKSISVGLVVLATLIAGCGKGKDDNNNSNPSNNKFVQQMQESGTGGCGLVEAFHEQDAKVKDIFLMKLSKNVWLEKECGTKREVNSFGGDHVEKGKDFALGATTMGCTSTTFDQALQSVVPGVGEKLVAFALSEGWGVQKTQRVLTWASENEDKKARCFVMAVDFQSSGEIKVGGLQEAINTQGVPLAMGVWLAQQKWRSMVKLP